MKPIYLEPDEEITSLIDRINAEGEHKLALVAAKNSIILQSAVNLKLIVREAKKTSKDIVIITTDKIIERLAQTCGIKTYSKLSGEPTPVKKVITEIQPAPDSEIDGVKVKQYHPKEISDDEQSEPPASTEEIATEEAEDNSSLGEPTVPVVGRRVINLDGPVLHFSWRSAVIAAVVVVIALILTALFVPRAEITLSVKARDLSGTREVTVRSDGTQDTLQGIKLDVEKSSEVEITATGKKDVGTKASGSVTVKNCEDSDSRTLASGSKLTSDAKSFTVTSAVTIPGGKFSGGGSVCNSTAVTVPIVADQTGDSYNLSNANFSAPSLSGRFTLTGTTKGGSTKEVTVLSETDISNARSVALSAAMEAAVTELTQSNPGYAVTKETISQKVISETVGAVVGDEVASTKLNISASHTTVAYKQADLVSYINNVISKELGTDEQLELKSEELKLLSSVLDQQSNILKISLEVKAYAIKIFNESEIKSLATNKSSETASQLIEQSLNISEVKVATSPAWWPNRTPFVSKFITVKVEVDTNDSAEVSQ